MSALLHLFPSSRDEADDRRHAQVERAVAQRRCGSCGRFARPDGLVFGAVCHGCLHSTRPVIVGKVAQARRWWQATSDSPAGTSALRFRTDLT